MTKAEEYIKNYTKNCSNECELIQDKEITWFQPWLTPDHALAAVAIERKELIDKACEFVTNNFKNYVSVTDGGYYFSTTLFCLDLKQAMEE